MKVPFYTSTREYAEHKSEFDSAIQAVLEKGDFILGSAVSEFEGEIETYSGAKHAIGVANGSDALVIASDILGYKDGAEVLTPTFTFFASTSCIARLGGTPIFTDVDPDTFCMDMNDAATRVTKKTTGILPVHLFTQMADMNACMKLAKTHKLSVLEDAAEAFGMKYKINGEMKTAGTIGDFGVYSFFPTKTLGGYGDGGMITTNSDEYFAKAKSLRVHGSSTKYYHDFVGYNSRLDTLQAAILRVKLAKIDEGIAKRAQLASQYHELLKDIPQITLPVIKEGNEPVYYVFTLKAENRDNLNEFLKKNEVGTSVYYPIPLHLQKCFEYLGHKKGDFPVAESLCSTVISLPMYPELSKDEVSFTCEKIREFYN
ncbi:MAG TPA: DegT/DnrJ/EryC1/StrS family aminotransferase [Treponemataceae bacterium]|nr:DegT/DnrJ/EryC1/StrS family aminotransferase [Treponemataceae bacterium]